MPFDFNQKFKMVDQSGRQGPDTNTWGDHSFDLWAPLIIRKEEIDAEAKRGLAANTRRSQEQIGRRLPGFANSLIRYGVGILDWDLRRAGGISYRVYHFVKD